MVVEWLRFQVKPELRERFVQKDAEIWDADHRKRSGFLKKEVWISSENLSEVILVIYWASEEDWFSIPKPELERVEQQFAAVMGADNYKLLETKAYQVRKSFQKPKDERG